MRVLVLGAGGNATSNYARAMRKAGHWTLGADPAPDMLPLSECDRTEILDRPDKLAQVNGLIDQYGIEVVHAQPDPEALWLAENAQDLNAATAVPQAMTIRLCQDKLAAASRLGELAPRSSSLSLLRLWLREHGTVWLRLRIGAGSSGALPTNDPVLVERWVNHWRQFGYEEDAWMVSEILPGRDLSWTGLYHHGHLVISVAKERLDLLGAARSPARVASTATRQIIVQRDDLNEVCEEAIRRVDQRAHGIFMVDARENADGEPKVTEINAGRFGTTMDFYAETGPNLCDIHATIAKGLIGQRIMTPLRDVHQIGAVQLRNTDCQPRVQHPEGITPTPAKSEAYV